MKIGLIDLGSNSIRLVIYEIDGAQFEPLLNFKHASKSALYIKDNFMSAEGIEVIVSSLKELIFVAKIYPLDDFRIYATASLRNIHNTRETIDAIEAQIHHPIEVISGQQESEYGFEAIALMDQLPEKGITIDIGGGSMEITYFEDKQLIHSTSIPIGSLTFFKQFVSDVLPNAHEQKYMRAFIQQQFDEIPWLSTLVVNDVIGIGGTSRAMMKLYRAQHQEKINQLSKNFITSYSKLNEKDAQLIVKAVPDRLITVVPGAILVDEIMHRVGASTFVVSKASLREGYLYHNILNKT
jgi:exopolyphosphatase / guanosine-5'-triphosphate,3'-diphosphate pyrophosphatase